MGEFEGDDFGGGGGDGDTARAEGATDDHGGV